jgi:hypothetical protein
MERLARDIHSSLLQTFVKYGRKSFITLGPVVVNELGNPKRIKEVYREKILGPIKLNIYYCNLYFREYNRTL